MRIEQLTFTRFVAAIAIVVYHFGMDLYPFNSKAVSVLFEQAFIGVSYFFILSGFVMIIAYGNRKVIDIRQFYLNRFARIYPAYILALILVLAYLVIRNREIPVLSLGLDIFVMQSWFPPHPLAINPPGWSLTVEFFFYAIFPFLFNLFYSKLSFGRIVFWVLLIWASTQIFFNIMVNSSFYEGLPSKSHDFLFYFPIMHLNEFLVGNLGGLLYLRIRNNAVKFKDGFIIILLAVIILLLRFPLNLNYHDGLLAIVFLPFIVILALSNGRISSLFNRKPLVFLGEISFGIYILQIPVFQWIRGILILAGIDNEYVLFYLCLSSLVLFSGLSYIYLEKPLRDAIKLKYLNKVPILNT